MAEQLLSISASSSREFQLIAVSLKSYVDRDLAASLRKVLRQEVEPIWRSAVAEQVSVAQGQVAPRLGAALFARTARAAVSDRNVTLKAAATGRPLRGGLDYRDRSWGAFEFGSYRNKITTYSATSSKGKRFEVRRRTRRQLPRQRSTGWIVYPAAAEAIPRIAALYAQTALRGLHEAIETTEGRKGG